MKTTPAFFEQRNYWFKTHELSFPSFLSLKFPRNPRAQEEAVKPARSRFPGHWPLAPPARFEAVDWIRVRTVGGVRQPVWRRGHNARKLYPGRRAMDRALRLLARSRLLSRNPGSAPSPGLGPGGPAVLLLRHPNDARMVSSCCPIVPAAPR